MSIKCCFFINNNDFKFQCEQNEVCELKKSNNKLKILKEETKTILYAQSSLYEPVLLTRGRALQL